MDKKFPYLPAVIALVAALVVSIVMLVNRIAVLKSLILILSFLVGFYILGMILRAVLIANATKEEEPDTTEEQVLEDVQTEEREAE